jgi:ribosomal protein S18 acetylase RimI-like enzyme
VASIEIIPAAHRWIASFRECLDAVARERKYIMFLEAPPLEEMRKFVEAGIARGVPQFFALDGGRVVGWCDITPMAQPGFTHAGRLGMGVLREYRRRGIGRRLVETTLRRAGRMGLERIELDVYGSNEPAIALYRKLGFVVEGVKKNARKLDGAYDDVLVMALLIPREP